MPTSSNAAAQATGLLVLTTAAWSQAKAASVCTTAALLRFHTVSSLNAEAAFCVPFGGRGQLLVGFSSVHIDTASLLFTLIAADITTHFRMLPLSVHPRVSSTPCLRVSSGLRRSFVTYYYVTRFGKSVGLCASNLSLAHMAYAPGL